MPALAYEIAVARPMPLEAPVMKTDLPLRFDFVVGSMAGYVSEWFSQNARPVVED